jgi:hypothetical protein
MTRTAKKWVGIALPIIVVLSMLIRYRLGNTPAQNDLQANYHRTRMHIGRQLMNLRHELGTKQINVSQNTALEIRMLWDDRDVLYSALNGRKSRFQSDSLIKLERLIDRRASLTTVLREIERIERINDTD